VAHGLVRPEGKAYPGEEGRGGAIQRETLQHGKLKSPACPAIQQISRSGKTPLQMQRSLGQGNVRKR